MAATLVPAYQEEIVRLIPETEDALDALRQQIRATVGTGAQLGAMIDEARRAHRDDLWSWLAALPVSASQEIIRFALRAYRAKQKDPTLGDPAQLSFALIGDSAADSTADDSDPPQSSGGGEWVALIKNLQRDLALITRLQQTVPLAQWTPVVRDNVRRALAPYVDLHKKLS